MRGYHKNRKGTNAQPTPGFVISGKKRIKMIKNLPKNLRLRVSDILYRIYFLKVMNTKV